MPRFYVSAEAVSDGRVIIEGADAAHLARSLRARHGERVVVADDGGREHGVVLDQIGVERIEGVVEWSRPSTGEARCRVHVLQSMPKDGMDDAVAALTEAGAAGIWPVVTERTVARPDMRRIELRQERWQAIAREAAGLSGRGSPPVVRRVMLLSDALAALPVGTRLLALTTAATAPLSRLLIEPASTVAAVVGPEGGLAGQDLAVLAGAGAEEVHLGPPVVRCRLAGAMAVELILARAGDLTEGVARAPLTVVRR
jgi:16S rRNA (uracil1498-N3)-methyltransferase